MVTEVSAHAGYPRPLKSGGFSAFAVLSHHFGDSGDDLVSGEFSAR
jgi:hypothetical protein